MLSRGHSRDPSGNESRQSELPVPGGFLGVATIGENRGGLGGSYAAPGCNGRRSSSDIHGHPVSWRPWGDCRGPDVTHTSLLIMGFPRFVLVGIVLGMLSACVSGGRLTPNHEAAGRHIVQLTYPPLMDAMARITAQEVSRWVQEESPLAGVIDQLTEPDRIRVRAATEQWAREVLGSAEIEQALARGYTEHFSEDELNELIAFFGAPTGQRLLSLAAQAAVEAMETPQGREAVARSRGEGPLSPELQEIATSLGAKLSGRLTSSEVEEGRRFFSTRVGRKVQAGLDTGLETTNRHMQRVATSAAAKDRLLELLRRALPGRKLPA
jgi:Uncharacterized protein conserved in bacteria (DUF2059)